MGAFVQAICECGFSSDVLTVGVGMRGPSPHLVLAVCHRCEDIVSVNVDTKRKRCPKCRGPVKTLAARGEAKSTPEAAQELLKCPKCARSTLELLGCGSWD